MTLDDKLTRIQNQIERLKKQKEKHQVQIALSFYKEVRKIYGKDFRPSFVVSLLEDIQALSPQIHKHEFEKHGSCPYWSCPCLG
jgi:geranylgeranyl pyrophosphate synthase